MPLRIEPRLVVTVEGNGPSVSGPVMNVWSLAVPDPVAFSQARAETIANFFREFYENLIAWQPSAFAWTGIRVQNRSTLAWEYYDFLWDVDGTGGNPLPGEMCAVLSLRSNAGSGGRYRNRKFIGPLATTAVEGTDAHIIPALRTAIFNAYVGLQNALSTDPPDSPVRVYSDTNNQVYMGITAEVDPYFDVQRRRGF